MKTVFLHGLGQLPRAWDAVLQQAALSEAVCPPLFSLPQQQLTYGQVLADFEKRCAGETEPFCICGLSLGAVLALDYTIRHGDKVGALVLIGAQYKVPCRLVDFQNLLFRCMPNRAFAGMSISKKAVIGLTRSMRSLDLSGGLQAVTCPVDILCGENDRTNLKAARQMAAYLPQAKLYIVPGAGHALNECAPGAIAAVLRK